MWRWKWRQLKFLVHCPFKYTWRDMYFCPFTFVPSHVLHISLLIIPCIIFFVTNKETLNLEPWTLTWTLTKMVQLFHGSAFYVLIWSGWLRNHKSALFSLSLSPAGFGRLRHSPSSYIQQSCNICSLALTDERGRTRKRVSERACELRKERSQDKIFSNLYFFFLR